MEEYTGKLGWWFETGSEGIEWIFRIDGKEGLFDFLAIEEDDHLIVYEADDSIIFDGIIICDHKIDGKPEQKYRQLCVFDAFWIHWTQQGWQPDDWALLFMRHDLEAKESDPRYGMPQLRAKLIRER